MEELHDFRSTFVCSTCSSQQRKTCSENCKNTIEFLLQHRSAQSVLGVPQVMKILEGMDPEERSVATKSIMKEIVLWGLNPIKGPYGVAQSLKLEIDACEKELERVNTLIQACKEGGSELGCSSSRPQQVSKTATDYEVHEAKIVDTSIMGISTTSDEQNVPKCSCARDD